MARRAIGAALLLRVKWARCAIDRRITKRRSNHGPDNCSQNHAFRTHSRCGKRTTRRSPAQSAQKPANIARSPAVARATWVNAAIGLWAALWAAVMIMACKRRGRCGQSRQSDRSDDEVTHDVSPFVLLRDCYWSETSQLCNSLIQNRFLVALVARWAPPLWALAHPHRLALGVALWIGHDTSTPTTGLAVLR